MQPLAIRYWPRAMNSLRVSRRVREEWPVVSKDRPVSDRAPLYERLRFDEAEIKEVDLGRTNSCLPPLAFKLARVRSDFRIQHSDEIRTLHIFVSNKQHIVNTTNISNNAMTILEVTASKPSPTQLHAMQEGQVSH